MAKFILDGQEYGGGGSGSNIVKLTQAEYDALSNDKLSNNTIYLITDSGELAAENLFYDGSQTGLGNNVQDAIDELNSNLGNKADKSDLDNVVPDMQWKSVGSVTGQKSISLPSDFNELSIIGKLDTYYIPFHIPKTNLSSSSKIYVIGWGKSNNTFIGLSITKSKVTLSMANLDGTSVITTSSMTVYYR